MKGAVRCRSLDMAGLAAQEKHGKRLDRSSARRRIRDADPLVHRTLDLADAYAAHMEGVMQNAGCKKPVLHFLVRFPPELLEDASVGPFCGSQEERQAVMLRQAVEFINETHGGDAVFAARVDRDEAGETIVDVFAAPRYEKRTKRTKPDERAPIWSSPTKFGKELAERHVEELKRRHPEHKGRGLTGPRMVGIALQSEFATFFQRENGVPLDRKVEKGTSAPDRLEIEAFKAVQDKAKKLDAREARLDQQANAQDAHDEQLDVRTEALERREAALEVKERELRARQEQLDQRETRLSRVLSVVTRLVGVVADRLGVGSTLREIQDAILGAGIEAEDPFQDADQDRSPGLSLDGP